MFDVLVYGVLLLASLVIGLVLMRRSMERFDPCVCRKCAYDLRETPSWRCPECGRSNGPVRGPPTSRGRSVIYVAGLTLVSFATIPLTFVILGGIVYVVLEVLL